MKKRPTTLSHSNTHFTLDAQTPASNGDFQFRVPEIPSRAQPRATSSSHCSDLDLDFEVLVPSSQPVFDHVEWQGSQTPSLRKVMEDARSLKRRAIKTRTYHEPVTSGTLSTDVAKNPRLPTSRIRPPLAECVKSRNQNDNNDQCPSSSKSVEKLSATADEYFGKIQKIMEKASKDMDRSNQILSKGRGEPLMKVNPKGRSKAERRKVWGGGVTGRVEKQRRGHGGYDVHILAVEGGERTSAKGKEREVIDDVTVDDGMDVDGNQSGMAMDVDLRLPIPLHPPPLLLPRSVRSGESLPLVPQEPALATVEMPPLRTRGQASIPPTSNHQPSADSRNSTSSRLARERDIRRALSSGPDGISGSKTSASPDARPSNSSGLSSLPCFFAASTSAPPSSSSSRSTSAGSGFSFETSSRDRGSSRSNFDSVYGSLPIPTKEQQKDWKERKERVVVPSPSSSPFVVPGLDHVKMGREKERVGASAPKRPPHAQEVKPASGLPVLGMRRRHNLPSNASNKSFKVPFKRGDSAKRLEEIAKGLEQRQETDNGPDIHEGEADSSSYSALDISMNSDLADELNNIEQKYSQDSMK
ncbi:hypothetical protein E1B28_002333 [Marasmius oreades]|uniref:Uncharacterized protein n=1 Tax=Marasmius oreades TaxID=181124 RepID=A0A9P7UL83_9AGAR|nr:uncharacterized protein E1B28_002333 [Marasmius oreades]KAG7086373.1 hypothetical protein E1B28_002333 [Marasmius oreades]